MGLSSESGLPLRSDAKHHDLFDFHCRARPVENQRFEFALGFLLFQGRHLLVYVRNDLPVAELQNRGGPKWPPRAPRSAPTAGRWLRLLSICFFLGIGINPSR